MRSLPERPRILIVADDPEPLEVLAQLLAPAYDLVLALSREQALEVAAEGPDLILLDQMRGLAGLEVCAALKAYPATAAIPVILVAGTTSVEDETAAFAAGAVDFINKPFHPAKVLARVANYITLKRQTDLLQRDLEEIKIAGEAKTRAIAELQKSQRNLLAVLNQFRGGTLLVDSRGHIEFASASFGAITACDPAVILGQGWDQALPLTAAAQAQLSAMMALPAEARSRLELSWKGPGGRRVWVEADVRDDPGDPDRRLLFLYDVTEVRELRRQIAQSTHHRMIGTSEAMRQLYRRIDEIARGDWTVLIEGETGAGKELVANAIHAASPRRADPFIAVNAAGLTPTLLTSQLFGHRKGAFTGAYQDQEGLFESARGGTLFLDEIGDLPIELQSALLRVLQEKEITRVGDTRPRKVDVRILAATHQDLVAATQAGRFRQDLLYRLRVARIQVTPLRERREDIPLLVRFFLDEASRDSGRQGLQLGPGVLGRLASHDWPGNIRELKSCIDQAVIHCQGDCIDERDLPPELRALAMPPIPAPSSGTASPPAPTAPAQPPLPCGQAAERERIQAALAQTRGNRLQAAKLLGIGRATLYRRLADLGLG